MPLQTSADKPAHVRTVAQLINGWVDRLGPIWIEGQVAQLTRRPGTSRVFLTLRDTAADLSLPVTGTTHLVDATSPPISEGDRIIIWAKPTFYAPRGSFSLVAREMRHVGLGELLARLERLKQLLAAEGLFAPERKRRLPFLPGRIGVVCGRASAAERDVVDNARRRWPGVDFRIEEVAVQGVGAAAQVTAAIQLLDADSSVDVIIVTRGGGAAEDLLSFSEETLLRAVANCATPLVSAIGHEQDTPLLDLVADLRASTPTDAARCVVPDFAEEQSAVKHARTRLRSSVTSLVQREQTALTALRGRPVLAAPQTLIEAHQADVVSLRDRATRSVRIHVDRAQDGLQHAKAQISSLSPQATLERGYAIIQDEAHAIVREPPAPGSSLRVRVARGSFSAVASADS